MDGCQILFAYDFGQFEKFKQTASELQLQIPLNLADNEEQLGKADGLQKFFEYLPLKQLNYQEFIGMVSKVKDESSLTFDIIKEAFSKRQEWQ